MVCHWHGRAISPDDLRKEVGLQFGEAELTDLQRAADALGFRTDCVRIDLDSLKRRNNFPAIVSFAPGHFVVLSGLTQGKFDVEDPARGRYRLSLKTFSDRYLKDGSCLVLEIMGPTGDAGRSKAAFPENKDLSAALPRWSPKHLWTAALLWLTTLLWLRWVELLFSAVAVRLIAQAFIPVVFLTALLGIAGFFLLRRWQLEVRCRLQAVQVIPPVWESGPMDDGKAWITWCKVSEERIRYGWNALLAAPLLFILPAFMALHSVSFATVLALGGIGFMWFYRSFRRDWLGRQVEVWDDNVSEDDRWVPEIFPKGSSVLAFFAALVLWSLHGWAEGEAPETFLIGFLVVAIWAVCLGATAAGIRSRALFSWGGVQAAQGATGPKRMEGDISLRFPSSRPGVPEIRIPSGKTTLLLDQDGQVTKDLMAWLSARETSPGLELSIGGIRVGPVERASFRSQVGEVLADGTVKLPHEKKPEPGPGPSKREGTSWIAPQGFPAGEWHSGIQTLLEAGATFLFVHFSFPALDPFRQLVIMEQIVAHKGSATLVMASSRTEAAASADWVVFIRDGQILGQGTPAEILGRFALDDQAS